MYEYSTCEKRMLLQSTTEAPKTCDIRYTPNHSDFWRRINAVDGWLFSIGTAGDLQVYCPGENAEITPLRGVGIVLFRPRCYGRYYSLTLNGIHTGQAPINFFYLPKIFLKIFHASSIPLCFPKTRRRAIASHGPSGTHILPTMRAAVW